jgi:gliding motility-associated-like protein
MKNYIKYMATGIFIVLGVIFHNTGRAQCTFDVQAEVIQHSTCTANGIVKITLTGEEVDLTNVFITLTGSSSSIPEMSSENGHQFGTLPPGNYTVTAQTVCKGTQNQVSLTKQFTIDSEYDGLNASLGSYKRSSLNCMNTGIASITLRDGRLPYKIEFTAKPAGYTGETNWSADGGGTYRFDGLAPGDYVFTVSDACGYTIPLTVRIDKVASDFPTNPYEEYFYQSNCNGAYVYEAIYDEANVYWNNNREEFYEIAFSTDGTTKDWIPVDNWNPKYINLPASYKTLYEAGATMKVYLRLKGTECEQMVNEIQFSEPRQINTGVYPDYSCENYKTYFYLDYEYMMCAPFKWEIFDETNTLVGSGEGLDYFETQSMENLLYNKTYTLKITDSNGTAVSTEIYYEQRIPYMGWGWPYQSRDKYTYDLVYDIYDLMCSYKWEVLDADNNVIKCSEELTNSYDSIKYLEYDKRYNINFIDANGNIIASFTDSVPAPNRYVNLYAGGGDGEWDCENYKVMVEPINVNIPYTWTVRDKDGKVVDTDVSDEYNNVIPSLQYGTAYTIEITDGISTVSFEIDETTFQSPQPQWQWWSYYDSDYKCLDYERKFEAYNIYCFPYKWELFDSDNKLLDSGPDNYEIKEHSVRLKYDVSYTIKITDSKGRETPLLYCYRADDYNLTPYFTYEYDVRQCKKYQHMFNVTNINCFPYKWEVFDSDNKLVASETDIIEIKEHNVWLGYDTLYTIKVTDDRGREGTTTSKLEQENTNISFWTYSYMSNCIENNFSGYMEIYGQLDSATNVRFISGPQTPPNADVTLTEDIYSFYPFSTDYRNYEWVPIAAGDYVFEITDKCGNVYPVNVSHNKSLEAVGFSYEKDETIDICNGVTRVYPKGRVHNNGTPSETWFEMIDPDGYRTRIQWSSASEYFTLSQTGDYVIGIMENDWDYCPLDTIVIHHVNQTFTIDGRSSYVCEEGTTGHIRVLAKNGKLPYTYTLLNDDSTPVKDKDGNVISNDTGEFEHGAFGEYYIVSVQDDCNKSFTIRVQINTIDPTTLINGMVQYCEGETLELNCLLLGATDYKWKDPMDVIYDSRNIAIPDITVDRSGEYIISVKPAGCDNYFNDTVAVEIRNAPIPDIRDTINLCQAEGIYQLSAEPANGNYSIQWYNEDQELLTAPPAIDLGVFAEYVFYVAHIENSFHCVSDKKKLLVIVNPLPEKNAAATGWSCENDYPEIVVTDIVEGYVYTVFADAAATESIMTFDGTAETMTLNLPVTVSDTRTFYLQTATAAGCTLSPSTTDIEVNVNKLTLSPEDLPVYAHEIPYSVQLTSNAEEPVFSYTDNLVTGISLTADGLISGTVPASAGFVESTFTVTVTDKNGCKTNRPYTLRSCGAAPDIASASLSYCEGSQTSPLEASSTDGYILQWYDAELNTLPEAPTPLTTGTGEQIFYVSQMNESLQCESGKATIKVKITPLPQPDFEASAGDVCYGDNPVINLSKLHSAYVYDIFSDEQLTEKLASVTGQTSDNVTLPTTPESATSYYVLVIDSLNCASNSAAEVNADVIRLELNPETLPVYAHEIPYSIQLTSNAEEPVFDYTGNLVTGIILTADGLISGTVPESAGFEESPFTVTVTDKNGCQTNRPYTLRSCGAAPDIASASLSYCEGSQAIPLQASSPEGYPLQWYDAELNTLPEAPTPLTTLTGEQIFYVSQINESLQCESGTAAIKVKITPLPQPDFEASAGDVCYGDNPVINLSNLHSTYVYDIFSDEQLTEKLASVTGQTSDNVTLTTTPESATSYYVLVIDSLNCASNSAAEVNADVIKLWINPETLPVYAHEIPYSVQLTSNAEEPVFSYVGNLVTGISLTAEGLISGTVPEYVGREESAFTVIVTDNKGCKTAREYLLRTCEPAPHLPIDTVVYCEGIQASPLQAYSPDGHILQWYDEEMNKLSGTPIPLTTLKKQIFYVAQVNELLQCEGEKAQVTVFSTPNPTISFKASVNDVCFGDSPLILLQEMNERYTYTVYSDSLRQHERGSLEGASSGVVNPDDILHDNTSYYVFVTDSSGCVSTDWLEMPVNVINLYINPEQLPPYHKNVEYEQTLTSNAVSPAFTLSDGQLPLGLSLSTFGLLYGKVPNSSHETSNIFTVAVHDVNGCSVTREYVLNGDIFVPKVFTPNGDGKNDVFMSAYKITIFDRLGKLIFSGDHGWDGTHNGKTVPPDIYFYKLEYMDDNNTKQHKTGYVGVKL